MMRVCRWGGIAAAFFLLASGYPYTTSPKDESSALVGAPAPDFMLSDSAGKVHRLSDYAGRVVILEWMSFSCPYTEKHYRTGVMQTLQRQAAETGIVWLSVVSDDSALHPEEYKAWRTALLLDTQGSAARRYQTKNTPHIFIIDAKGILAYSGAVDSNPTPYSQSSRLIRNYVREALEDLVSGRGVATPITRPYGCLIKYAQAAKTPGFTAPLPTQ